MDLNILGLVFGLIGSLILVCSSFLVPKHQKNYVEKWTRRYWWQGWRPIFKVSPLNKLGRPLEIMKLFGGKDGYKKMIKEIESRLYK